jgi:hypothetical protein
LKSGKNKCKWLSKWDARLFIIPKHSLIWNIISSIELLLFVFYWLSYKVILRIFKINSLVLICKELEYKIVTLKRHYKHFFLCYFSSKWLKKKLKISFECYLNYCLLTIFVNNDIVFWSGNFYFPSKMWSKTNFWYIFS